jgi:SLOG cluster3 family
MNPVFLSASIPYPREEKPVEAFFLETCDRVAIREAVRALCMVVLPQTKLVFGGHPFISPFVLQVAEALERVSHVVIYQSKFFAAKVPPESRAFDNIVWTEAVEQDRDASLLAMRERMLSEWSYGAGVFIGGMDGVIEEFNAFRKKHTEAAALPIASTGAAALRLWGSVCDMESATGRMLKSEFAYQSLFRRLLPDTHRDLRSV